MGKKYDALRRELDKLMTDIGNEYGNEDTLKTSYVMKELERVYNSKPKRRDGWISVTDEPVPVNEEILIYVWPYDRIYEVFKDSEDGTMYFVGADKEFCLPRYAHISYWRPLPASPMTPT